MAFVVEYLEDNGIVFCESDGDMAFTDYKQQTEEMILLSRQHNTGLYMSDIRRVINRAGLADILRLNALYSQFGQSKDTRLALIVDRNQRDYNLTKIFELSCTVRGWNVRCFLAKDEAVRWLLA